MSRADFKKWRCYCVNETNYTTFDYMQVQTWGLIIVLTFTFGIQEYTMWRKGIMQYS